ncbi:MAG: hypothetical protein KGN02_13570 [bacterium]|nr:hypothetical protein [bacterium]
MRRLIPLFALALALGAAALSATRLPTNWLIAAPTGRVATTGTMPQGLALSPDGTKLAVIDAGFNPPALRVLASSDLHTLEVISLRDGFGTPVWAGNDRVLIPGASTNAILDVDLASHRIGTRTLDRGGRWVSALATDGARIAVAYDFTDQLGFDFGKHRARGIVATGAHPGAVVLDGSRIFVANRGASSLTVSVDDARVSRLATIPVDLHPSALALSADRTRLYVACADADVVDVVDTASERVVERIAVGLPQGPGASPNALALAPDGTLYVSLGAENAIAEIRNDRVVARMPTGWYPTGIAANATTVFVADGKGEESRANPAFDPRRRDDPSYVAAALVGSVRAIARGAFGPQSTARVLADIPRPQPTPPQTVVRAHGPIRHVIYIIKENRTYDQVLGDLAGGNGDPQLAWFGAKVTPNEHAIATRFGIFDDTFTDAQVSATGHNWSTAAFANDYLERMWPPDYAGRRDLYDFEDGAVASTPRNGYLWDDANRAHVAFRDYGEFVSAPAHAHLPATTQMPGLVGRIDPKYPGFDLAYSDEARIDEWQHEFEGYVAHDDLPPLEIVRLPNDHTWGTRAGKLTPQAYVAQNDHALGRLVDVVSHSPYWKDTAIFAIEDDAQNGPDHVDDQRTTFYLASPYAAPGVHHEHYTTSSVVRTIELLLGLAPMSIYDAVAPPMYDAFALEPRLKPYDVIAPKIDVHATNAKTAYGAALSAKMDFRHADDADSAELNDILAHAAGMRHP